MNDTKYEQLTHMCWEMGKTYIWEKNNWKVELFTSKNCIEQLSVEAVEHPCAVCLWW